MATDSLDSLLQAAAAGRSPWKFACRVVASTSITLQGLQTVDGVALAAGDRVLVAGQTDGTQNGIYNAANGVWTRAVDMNQDVKAPLGTTVLILAGTSNAGKTWALTSPTSGTPRLGATALAFTLVLSGGGATTPADPATTDPTATLADHSLAAGNVGTGAGFTEASLTVTLTTDTAQSIGGKTCVDTAIAAAAAAGTIAKLPILVVGPGYHSAASSTPDSACRRWARRGWYVIALGQRTTPDDGAREIYDWVDAVNYVRATTAPTVVSTTKAFAQGYSTGGGRALLSVLKHPDFWSGAACFFPVTDFYRSLTDSLGGRRPDLATPIQAAVGVMRSAAMEPYVPRCAVASEGSALGCVTPSPNIWAMEEASDATCQFASMAQTIRAHNLGSALHWHQSQPGDAVTFNHGDADQFTGNTYAERYFNDAALAAPKPAMKRAGTLRVLGYIETALFKVWTHTASFGTYATNPKTVAGAGRSHAVELTYDVDAGIYRVRRVTAGTLYVRVVQGSLVAEVQVTGDSAVIDINAIPPAVSALASLGFTHEYRADMGITQVSGDVATWADQIGAVNATTGGNRPAFNATGGPSSAPSVYFDKANSESLDLVSPLVPTSATASWTMIARCYIETTPSGSGTVYSQGNASNTVSYMRSYQSSGFAIVDVHDNGANLAEAGQSGFSTGAWHTFVTRYDGSTGLAYSTIDGANSAGVAGSPGAIGATLTDLGCIGANRDQSGRTGFAGMRLCHLALAPSFLSNSAIANARTIVETAFP